MFRYCPSCASEKITFENERRFYCPECGFVYYHNTAAAAGCVIETGGGLVLLLRAKQPARGKLDLPGGFIDPGEGVLEGLLRECREELGWEPRGGFAFLASFPNVYPYKGIAYRTCDIFFTISAPGLTEKDLRLDAGEIGGVRFIKPGDIDFDELAFDSTRRALRAYLERVKKASG
jgi:ADP-ribose pyrophosphatase YjhB (NUDIX family)